MGTTTVGQRKPASEAVVEAVSAREGIEPTALDEPLFEAVDPEGLDRIVESGSRDEPIHISFTYYGYHVTVSSAGGVTLEE